MINIASHYLNEPRKELRYLCLVVEELENGRDCYKVVKVSDPNIKDLNPKLRLAGEDCIIHVGSGNVHDAGKKANDALKMYFSENVRGGFGFIADRNERSNVIELFRSTVLPCKRDE